MVRRRGWRSSRPLIAEPLEPRLLLATHSTPGLYAADRGVFFLRNDNSPGPAHITAAYGPAAQGWLSITGDWNGDGRETLGLFDPQRSTFFLRNENSAGVGSIVFAFGPADSDWRPLAGDWDGDGIDTVGLYDPASGTFFLNGDHAPGPAEIVYGFGPAAGWIPLAGDWDATGSDTPGLYSPGSGTFFLRNAHAPGPADVAFAYGPVGAGLKPLVGDWDGDGRDSIGLVNGQSTFFLKNALVAGSADMTMVYGPGPAGGGPFVPLAGDWDGLDDLEPPSIAAALLNDTGADPADGLTADATIAGQIADSHAIRRFKAGLDAAGADQFFDLLGELGPDGSFVLDGQRLAEIHGSPLADGDHVLRLLAEDELGHVSALFELPFTLDTRPGGIVDVTPRDGDDLVSPTRQVIVRFNEPLDPATVNLESISLSIGGLAVPGAVELAASGLFAVFVANQALASSALIDVAIDGGKLRGREGLAIDADGNGTAGGLRTLRFRAASHTRVPGTHVFGYVYDSRHKRIDGGDLPVVGATIRVPGLPAATTTTDENGYFILRDTPAPIFHVEIDGSTAAGAPDGGDYAALATMFHSAAGQSTQLANGGAAYDIYLPTLNESGLRPLDADADTRLMLGEAAAAELAILWPDVDPEVWERVGVTVPAGAALDASGSPVERGALAPVDPHRLPNPVTGGFDPGVVFSLEVPGSDFFQSPAPVVFPNLLGLPPGAASAILSFDPQRGSWGLTGTGTVSDDGAVIESDAGSGLTAPGWHATVAMTAARPDLPPLGEGPAVPLVRETAADGSQSVGLGNHFILRDGEPAFEIEVKNAAPLGSRALFVRVDVDGPAMEFLEGELLTPRQAFLLAPGQSNRLTITPKDIVPEILRRNLTNDQLFGVQLRLTFYDSADMMEPIGEEEAFIGRFLAVVDPETSLDPTAEHDRALFLRTLADGGGGFVREKTVSYHLPQDVDSSFTVSGDDEASFSVGGPVRGDGTTVWSYDPLSPGRDTANVTLAVGDDSIVDALSVGGSAVGPTRLNVGASAFKAALVAYLSDPANFRSDPATGEPLQGTASIAFRQAFAGVLPSDSPDAAAVEAVAGQMAQLLVDEVAADFAPVNANGPAVEVVPDGGDGPATYQIDPPLMIGDVPVLGTTGRPIDSLLIAGPNPDELRGRLSSPAVPNVAREYTFAESLNPTVGDGFIIDLARHAASYGDAGGNTNGLSFQEYVANTASHELGHTLGLLESYVLRRDDGVLRQELVSNPGDLMRAGSDMCDLEFARRSNLPTLMAATGVAPNEPEGLTQPGGAVPTYRANINLPGDLHGFEADVPGIEASSLDVADEGGSLLDGGRLDFGTVLADGAAGSSASRIVNLLNKGSLLLSIANVSVEGAAFSLTGPPMASRMLAIGESVAIELVFNPAASGAASGVLVIQSDDPATPSFTLNLVGDGLTTSGRLAIALPRDPSTGQAQNNLGGVEIDSPPIDVDDFLTLTNTGGGVLSITGISLDAAGASQFSLIGLPAGLGPAHPLMLAPGQSRSIAISFDARNVGLQRAFITIASNDPAAPQIRQTVVATGLASSGASANLGDDLVAIHSLVVPPSGGLPSVQRVQSSFNGDFELFLPLDTSFRIAAFDHQSGLIWNATGDTATTARDATSLGGPVFLASIAPDSDGDGLPDDIELAAGTSADDADSDDDGLDDFAELV